MTTVLHPDGRMSQYPPVEKWDDWVEWDGKHWPRKVARHYTLVPTVCFNCESACGLLAYVDRETLDIKKFEGNPAHPGSRGRNCAKGPATINQIYDPERILYPLKRVGKRGEGKWKRVSWDEVLEELGPKMAESRNKRRDGIMYHVGRPGEDGYTNRCIQAWGVDGHNSHTNICSGGARAGYNLWAGFDRPSPDYANANTILLISSHLETGHYFNPHAQRIMEAKMKGAKLITMDPRLSNTASKSDTWLPTWPGSEQVVLLAIANHLIQNGLYDKDFMRRWVNWRETLDFFKDKPYDEVDFDLPGEGMWDRLKSMLSAGSFDLASDEADFDDFDRLLKTLYAEFTFERAAEESQVDIARIREAAEAVANCQGRLATHTWRAASIGNLGGWQVARCLLFLNVLTGSIGNEGGTSGNSWNKFVPKPFDQPEPFNAWNELHIPHEWPMAMYEMSFLLPHFLEEGRGDIDVYFTRVYNPLWINPDGFMWMRALQDEEKIKCHVAMTPTWNESAWFADYVLPMGHAGERHDLMSQETHAGQWIAFRQPVRRVAMERLGKKVDYTWQANPGEVWEENEFWIELSAKMDPDGSLGVRKHFESPYRKGEIINVDEYYQWIFENSVPGLPEAAEAEGLKPLEYMRKYAAFEVTKDRYVPYEAKVDDSGSKVDNKGRILKDGSAIGVMVDGVARSGFATPSKKMEIFSPTMRDWGWPELDYTMPWPLKSHVHPDQIDREKGEMLLLPNFRLPTLIHTRSANAKWLYELSHKNPVWMHPGDARRLGIDSGDLIRVTTRIGYFVDKVWVTEGIKPGVIAMSHHLGRWRLKEEEGLSRGASNLVTIDEKDTSGKLRVVHGAGAWESFDPDTSRIWWEDVGVHQNLTHAVHPDPVSGHHCWLQKAFNVEPARAEDRHGDVWVDTNASMENYREWVEKTRSAVDHSPDGTRRPWWMKRPLKPVKEAYTLPDKPFGR
ncbi:MAG: molybdopterin-dependent oxidoreductase [Bacteroidetes Order II. Incertae sedis bacterium]|nr:molybdopterin-dependent oxidoreductase [Bacteroidetes Order II. bacterium]HAY36251.1 formate dehydrogenase [Bacteroidota bacterium]MBT4603488.1 molybdopterin-dependent oxidoreductase [Bacteroidetes Order II. bacterium]MBT6199658.1 molybdopterin-dependent oxidoreductase [Bacteroidetes Order II. bacterium]MBT6425148.1 molybdopterin-dependent oxidoreductase [Bacteroidetes Order II. bacterium]